MRVKKEERPVFTKVADRPEAETRAEQRILNNDNHRTDRFGGYAHDVRQIITEDELWDALQKFLADRAKQQEENQSDLLTWAHGRFSEANSLSNAFSLSAFAPKPLDAPLDNVPLYSARESIMEIFNRLRDKSYSDLATFPDPKIFDDRKEAWEQEQAFRRAASWLKVAGEPVSEEWKETQEKLKPSLLDEDDLGTFDEWLDFTPPTTQYLLLGDTNHYNKFVQAWRKEGSFLQKLKEKGFDDIVLERPAAFNAVYERIHNGDVAALDSPDLKGWGDRAFLEKAQALGIRVHAFDRQIENKYISRKEQRETYLARHQNEEVLAADIKAATGERKTTIIYGCAHFAYENGLADLLGLEKCRHVNIHPNLADYHDPKAKLNALYPAPYVYVIEEGAVIASKGEYQRQITPHRDGYLSNVVLPTEERKEIEKFSDRLTEEKSRDPSKYDGITPDQIVDMVRRRRDDEDRTAMRRSLIGMLRGLNM